MFKQSIMTAAAAALLAPAAGAVHAERIALTPGLHSDSAVAHRGGRDNRMHGDRDRRGHGFHHRENRLLHWHRSDPRWHHRRDFYRRHAYGPRHYHFGVHGIYFPGYGLVRHDHRHTRFCPDWHFRIFATDAEYLLRSLDR